MKKQITKILTKLFIILTAGAFFTGCGFSYVINSANTLKKEDAETFVIDKSVTAPITELQIHTGMAQVELIPSDNYYVEINYLYWNEKPEYTLEDGVLIFDDSDALPNSYSINFKLDNYIKIYLPEAAVLNDLLIENSSGDVTVAGFFADNMQITVSYGDFAMQDAAAAQADITLSSGNSQISDFQVGTLDFTNSYGNAEFTNINTDLSLLPSGMAFDQFNVTMSSGDITLHNLKSNSVDLNDSYGDITCDAVSAKEAELNLSSGNLKLDNADIMELAVNNSYGDATLSLLGSSEDYGMDLNTSYGKIKVGDKDYEEQLTIENSGSRSIKADLSSGDVRVKFQEK